MPEINVIRHVVRPHQPHRGEEYDPGGDMLIIVHRNPDDPNDPTEFGHHVRLQGLAYRKEMWGLTEYADVVDMELRDLERYYFRDSGVDYGPHPLADITEHYYNAPPERMKGFAPDYVIDRMASAIPFSTDARHAFALDVLTSGVEDVKHCLSSPENRSYPCRNMTGLATDTRSKRADVNRRMERQSRRAALTPGKGLDDVRQYLTDRAGELESVRERFVNQVLSEAHVPGVMLRRIQAAVQKRAAGVR